MTRAILSAVAASILVLAALPARAQMSEAVRQSGPAPVGAVTPDQVAATGDHTSFEQEYARRLLDLPGDDVQGHYDLALWCRQRKQLAQAREELLKVLRLQPEHANARLMLQLVDTQLADRSDRHPPEAPRPRVLPGTKIPLDLLVSEDDVFRIRLAELRSSDRVAIAFRGRADYRFVERMRGTGLFADSGYERAFLAKPPVARAIEMLTTSEAEDLRGDILIRTNPRFMTTFKTRIWPMIARNCASAECHGSPEGAGRLRLFNARSRADELCFTNFLLLDAFESGRGRMINRDYPARSLLLQFALPPDKALVAHPVPIRPLFRSADDRQYKLVDEWIRTLLHPHPQYTIDYRLPGNSQRSLFAEQAATPADAPAGEAAAPPDGAQPEAALP
ncbi:MAG: hypothetical protein GX591_03100 [Planctomycetes bacterium]|nr:hypothetical protein [Planctomycetota bacterium]